MGTKRQLGRHILQASHGLQPGPFMDLFAGISAAGTAVAGERNVWCNDAQAFSQLLTEALYTSSSNNIEHEHIASELRPFYHDNMTSLREHFKCAIDQERAAIQSGDLEQFNKTEVLIRHATRNVISKAQTGDIYSLFTTTHAGSYFSLLQCIEIDSIRYAADRALSAALVTPDQHRWAVVALCRAAAAASNSTGHFAQYLTAKAGNLDRVLSKRKRVVSREWISALRELHPLGSTEWRRKNRVFRGDAVELSSKIRAYGDQPGIVYADPPYTDDQYSRYYHVFETLVLYDYPDTSSKGEYRRDRFISRFSLKSKVEEAFRSLVFATSHLNSALMISYPSNGLLSVSSIRQIVSEFYCISREPIQIAHQHSTLGASKGAQKHSVTEHLFVAEKGRYRDRPVPLLAPAAI